MFLNWNLLLTIMIYNIVKERVGPILILKIGSVGGEGQGEIHFDGLTKYSGTLHIINFS